MAAVVLESSIERASKVVRSRIKGVLGRKIRGPSMERPLNQHYSPSQKVFELFFARPARRTVSLLRSRQQNAVTAKIPGKRLAQAPFLSLLLNIAY